MLRHPAQRSRAPGRAAGRSAGTARRGRPRGCTSACTPPSCACPTAAPAPCDSKHGGGRVRSRTSANRASCALKIAVQALISRSAASTERPTWRAALQLLVIRFPRRGKVASCSPWHSRHPALATLPPPPREPPACCRVPRGWSASPPACVAPHNIRSGDWPHPLWSHAVVHHISTVSIARRRLLQRSTHWR